MTLAATASELSSQNDMQEASIESQQHAQKKSSRSLDESLGMFADMVNDCIKSDGSILVMSHMDCDGLCAGSIITKALIREGARCSTTTSKEFGDAAVNLLVSREMRQQDMCIITDLGGGFASKISNALGDQGSNRWIILDHHQIPDSEMDEPNVINAWKYGINGGLEISAGGMAYLAAMSLDEKNTDLSAMAVVSALGDRQDQGERRSLVGKNFEIAEAAKGQGLLEVDMDLLFFGRETKPLADAMAYTSQPYIDGLTWNRDTCYSLLTSAKINLKEDGRWRVPAELSEDEKKRVIESIAQFAPGEHATQIMSELIGYAYTLPKEDGRGFLRDAREFSTMLNSCGRIGTAGIGIAICMGDRSRSLQEGERILRSYKGRIRECINILTNERWRASAVREKPYITINAQDVVQETMSGTIASIMAGSPKNAGKIVILWTKAEEESMLKFSARRSGSAATMSNDNNSRDAALSINLGHLMSNTAKSCGGVGGGHDGAAGAKITKDKLEEFLVLLDENVTTMYGADKN